MQFIAFIHGDSKSETSPEEWEAFFAGASQSGLFRGGSEIGERTIVGDNTTAKSSDHIVGYMRFDSDNTQAVLDLLATLPTVVHGGSVELCEMRES